MTTHSRAKNTTATSISANVRRADRRRSTHRISTALAALLFSAVACMAGEGDYKGEITGFGGLIHFPGSTKAMVGGEIGRALGQSSQLFAETNYAPLGDGAKLMSFGGGLHVGIGKPRKFTPYATFMGGVGRFSGYGDADNAATFGVGGGVRYFLGRNWGVRPEFRWQRFQVSGGGVNSYVARAGLFYRFGSN